MEDFNNKLCMECIYESETSTVLTKRTINTSRGAGGDDESILYTKELVYASSGCGSCS